MSLCGAQDWGFANKKKSRGLFHHIRGMLGRYCDYVLMWEYELYSAEQVGLNCKDLDTHPAGVRIHSRQDLT